MSYKVVVVGAGPAGLSAALNLARARRRLLLIDSNRPRNAATLASHGFVTRDGVSPLELRRLGWEEVTGYDEADGHRGALTALRRDEQVTDGEERGFVLTTRGLRGEPDREERAAAVVIAAGLVETLPDIPGLRAYYGTQLHSCIECDAHGKSGKPLVLLGETADLAERALLLAHWAPDLVVLTHGSAAVTAGEEDELATEGIRVDRRRIAEVLGDRGAMTGVRFEDGEVLERAEGFVRPRWRASLDYLADDVAPDLDSAGLVWVDDSGRTSVPGLYAAGDVTPPGPRQLIVAAGAGALVADAVNRDLLAARREAARLAGETTGLGEASNLG